MRFASTSFAPKGDGTFELAGDLTIRDVTKNVTLLAEYGGQMTDFYGNTKAGFEIAGTINRKEFGLAWDAVTEAGGIVVSDAVKLQLNIQLQKS
jgi:polyisoprenoid-binding protein YceI